MAFYLVLNLQLTELPALNEFLSSGITIPGAAQGRAGCDTWCHGLVGKVLVSQRLYSMVLESLPTVMVL